MLAHLRQSGWLCGVAALALGLAAPALAQDLAAPAEAPPVSDDLGVIAYPADFFAQWKPQTAMNMISLIPGFSFDGGSNGRGFAGNAGNVLIDGARPPSQNDSLSSVLDRIPAASVERIDLVRGGAGGIDMHGKSVIANIIRKKQTRTSGALTAYLDYSSYQTIDRGVGFQIQRRRGDQSFDASINISRSPQDSRGWTLRIAPGGTVLQQTRSDGIGDNPYYSATAAAETPLFGGDLRVNGRASYSDYTSSSVRTLIIPGGAEFSGNGNIDRSGELGGRYERILPWNLKLEVVSLHRLRSGSSSSYLNTPTFTSNSIGSSNSLESVISTMVSLPDMGPWAIEGGTELAYNRQENTSNRALNGAAFNLAGDTTQVEELRNESFLTSTWRPNTQLSVELGARYERSTITATGSAGNSEQTLGYLKPRLFVSWSPDRANQFGLRVEREVNQLSFNGFQSSASFNTGIFGVGNPGLKPETHWEAEATWQGHFWTRGSVNLSLLARKFFDITSQVTITLPDPVTGAPKLFDITRNNGTSTGQQYTFDSLIPLDRFGVANAEVLLHGQVMYSKYIDPVTGFYRRRSTDTPSSWNVTYNQRLQGNRYSISARISGASYSNNFQPRSIGVNRNPMRASLTLGYRPTATTTWTLDLNNLPGKSAHNLYTLYGGPRSTASVTYVEQRVDYRDRSAKLSLRQTF